MIKKLILLLLVVCGGVVSVEGQTYTVAGSQELLGSNWNAEDTNNDMVNISGTTIYTLSKTVSFSGEKDIQYKVVKDHDFANAYGWTEGGWGEDKNAWLKMGNSSITESMTYNVIFRFNATDNSLHAFNLTAVGSVTNNDSEAGLFGTAWDLTNDNNLLTIQSDGLTLQLVKRVTLNNNTSHAYKIVNSRNWDNTTYPANNGTIAAPSVSGEYDVVFKFNLADESYSAAAFPVYTIAGTPSLTGKGTDSNWDITSLEMQTTDYENYILTLRDVSLKKGTTYYYKVVGANTWDINYGNEGAEDGANVPLTVGEDGVYDVTFAFDKTSHTPSATTIMKKASVSLGTFGYTTFASASPLNLNEIEDGFTAYYVANSPTTTVKLTKATGNIKAGEGIILYGETPNAEVTIPVATSGSEISGNLLVGCPNGASLTKTTPGYENIYVLVNSNTNNQAEFQNVKEWLDGDETLTIPAGKAYLQATGLSAPSFSIELGDETTGIMETVRETTTNNQYYTFDGRRVAQPTKGLYIVNGKKVIIK